MSVHHQSYKLHIWIRRKCDGGGSDRHPSGCVRFWRDSGLWRRASAGEAGDSTTSDARGLGVDRGKTGHKTHHIESTWEGFERKQIPQVIENPESGDQSREALETIALRVKQAL